MSTYNIKDFEENFGEQRLEYPLLCLKTEMEKGDGTENKHLWGKHLSLSLIDTINYCEQTTDFFVPSSALLADTYIHCLKNENDIEAKQILRDFNNYWHRTMSVIVFPSQKIQGYVVHYPHIYNNELIRENGKIVGDIVLELTQEEAPPLGKVVYLNEHPDFFNKLLGLNTANRLSQIVQSTYGFLPSVWIPPEVSLQASPERQVIFGAFIQYGQGLWLTSNSSDKTIVGTRPFRGAYKI